MHQLPMESVDPREWTASCYQAVVHQALVADGGGSMTPELDQRQREERHMQEEEEALPRTLERVGQSQQTGEPELDHEPYRPATPATSRLHEHWSQTWEASGGGPPHRCHTHQNQGLGSCAHHHEPCLGHHNPNTSCWASGHQHQLAGHWPQLERR